MPRTSLKKIALELGVSEQTVSRALRNERYVRPELREKICQTAQRMGYRPDPRLKALMQHIRQHKEGRSSGETIALILPDSTPEEIKGLHFMGTIAEGARLRAEQSGFGFQIHSLQTHSHENLERLLWARGIGLLIIAPVYHGLRQRISFHWERYATVLIGPGIWRPQLNRVLPNYYLNMIQMMRRLKKLGYRRPALVIERQVLQRAAGAVEAAFRQNADGIMGVKDANELTWSRSWRDCREEMAAWLRKKKIDVIIGDQSGCQFLERIGFRVPEEMGYASIICPAGEVETSGIFVRADILGANAVDLLAGHYLRNERGIPPAAKIVLHEGRWQLGKTVRQRS